MGEEERNIRDAETLMLLESMLAGYGLELLDSYNDRFCYRMGPFTSQEEAAMMMDLFMTDIGVMNEINAASGADQYFLDVAVSAPGANSVSFSSSGGILLFTFAIKN